MHKNDSVDTAIADLHAWRRELSEQFGNDMQAIVEDAINRQKNSGRRIIRRGELKKVPNRPHGASKEG